MVNAFSVDRANPGPSVLKIPSRLLAQGEVVGIFPSGTRIEEQTALKQGAITIAMRSKVINKIPSTIFAEGDFCLNIFMSEVFSLFA